MTNIKNKTLKYVVTLILVFCIAVMAVQDTYFTALAAEITKISFDQTYVLDDLKTSTINGKSFDIKSYPFDESKNAQVISFIEYCYSFKANMRTNYGLYVYVYNPKGLNLSTNSKQNKIQMAVSYDTSGNPIDYAKFDLQFCSMSTDSNYYRLFYKYKIIDREISGETFSQRINSNERRYDISSIELLTYGQQNATDYNVGGSYKFTGYSEGYGPDSAAKNTLSSNVHYLETVELNVNHTFYRTKTSIKGAGYQNQLDTVYFAVPKRLFNEYGYLQRIKAEWYEYKTNDIVVTSNSDFYNKVQPYLGVQTGTATEFGMPNYNSSIYYSLGQNAGDWGNGFNAAKWGWNLGTGYLHPPCLSLYYLFLVNNIKEYDPYADIVSTGGVESNALYESIKNYTKTFNKGTLPIKNGTISADLFTEDIDAYRKIDTAYGKIQNGYSYYDFDAGVDLQKLSSWQEGNPSFWDNWINWGLWNAMSGNIPNETSRTLSPIYNLKAGDLNGTNAEISDRLLVNANDVTSLRNLYNEAATVNPLDKTDEEKVVVLFRFAASDYYSAPIDIIELGKGFLWSDKFTSGQAYRAWESVFFDFDIIQLSFLKDGIYTVIPAVSSPIDIINGITPPINMPDLEWWKVILGVILLVILLVLFSPLLGFILKGTFWILKLPFKFLKLIFIRRTK